MAEEETHEKEKSIAEASEEQEVKEMWEKIQSQKNPTERYGMSSEM